MRRPFLFTLTGIAVVGAVVVGAVVLGTSSVGAAGKAKVLTADGVTLIDQSMITNANGPYHITQSGSYRLSSSLQAPPHPPTAFYGGFTEAIIIDASNVSLDLNGFTVNGGGYDEDHPGGTGAITAVGTARHVSVTNGVVVSEQGVAIRLSGSGALVEGTRVTSPFTYPIQVGADSLVRGNTFDGGSGVFCGAGGVVAVDNAPQNCG